MDRLEAMTTLVAVVETGSFTAAARRLGAPLPTVSRKIAELEAHLGARLLTRSTRRLALTDVGADYVAACRRILESVGEAERRASGEYVAPRGELVMTAPLAFGQLHVAPVVAEFLATYPEIDVRLRLADRNARLIDDHIDVAARIGALTDSSLIALRLGAVRWVVCASPQFLAANGHPRSPEDLARFDCVTFDLDGDLTAWTFAGPSGPASAPARSRLSVNTAEAAIDAAAAGVGLTRVLSYQAAVALAQGRLEATLEAFSPEPAPVHLLHPAQPVLPLKTRAFLDFAAPRLRARLAAI